MMPQTTPPPVGLCVQDLTVRYGTAAVLQGVSFSVPVSGQLIGLLGVNGSGKTTLLKAAAGLLPHTGQPCAVRPGLFCCPPSPAAGQWRQVGRSGS